jgi:hypothetical protein
VAAGFFEHPILNSPYAEPTRHHALSEDGQPLNLPPRDGRRPSALISPVPAARKQSKRARQDDLFDQQEEDSQQYTLAIINEIRGYVSAWRRLKNPADWGVTPVTQRLLKYWREHEFGGVKPFFCQIEAVETAIWLAEVAPRARQHAHIARHIQAANAEANPELLRIALKLATGAGKTTVMAMLIAWQTLNAVRTSSPAFSRAFLIVAPGITIRDRLQILQPSHPDNYYARRELVPADMLDDMTRAKIVLTNYHAFKRRETMEISKVGKALLQGRGDAPLTTETEGAMLKRACGELLGFKHVVVINDEAHHCYREKAGDAEAKVTAEEREEARRNAEAARLWISGLEALKRKVGVRTVYDLSATPFFLRGSGYREGTLFPWTVCDFSLMDATRTTRPPRPAPSTCSSIPPRPVCRCTESAIPRIRTSGRCGSTSTCGSSSTRRPPACCWPMSTTTTKPTPGRSDGGSRRIRAPASPRSSRYGSGSRNRLSIRRLRPLPRGAAARPRGGGGGGVVAHRTFRKAGRHRRPRRHRDHAPRQGAGVQGRRGHGLRRRGASAGRTHRGRGRGERSGRGVRYRTPPVVRRLHACAGSAVGDWGQAGVGVFDGFDGEAGRMSVLRTTRSSLSRA